MDFAFGISLTTVGILALILGVLVKVLMAIRDLNQSVMAANNLVPIATVKPDALKAPTAVITEEKATAAVA
jgi:hypothetical protein